VLTSLICLHPLDHSAAEQQYVLEGVGPLSEWQSLLPAAVAAAVPAAAAAAA